MRERPILMSAPMVKALLAGTKSQTRRIVKGDVANVGLGKPWVSPKRFGKYIGELVPLGCPYGVPGDRLWVRETFALPPGSDEVAEVVYRADLTPEQVREEQAIRRRITRDEANMTTCGYEESLWRPSIHMRREYSRLTLTLTAVRVERLQDISEADAQAEGITEPAPVHGKWCDPAKGREGHWSYRKPYADLWESINGLNSWDANPWVWVLTFTVEAPTNG